MKSKMTQKEKDIAFIKEVSNVNITNICKNLNVDKSNLYHGKASEDATHKVAKEVQLLLLGVLKYYDVLND